MIMMGRGRGRPKHPQSNAANNPFWGTGGMDNGDCGNVDGWGMGTIYPINVHINLSIYVNICMHWPWGKEAWIGIGEWSRKRPTNWI
jgi:hypothetical protein